MVLLVLVVDTLDNTLEVHSDSASCTTVSRDVPSGISFCTFSHACLLEIQEMPTREVTTSSLKEKTAPTRVSPDDDDATPSSCSSLPSPSFPT